MSALATVEAHLAAYNARDLRSVVTGFAEDAVYVSAEGPVAGRRALFAMFREAFSGPAAVRLEIRRAVADERTVAAELAGCADLGGSEVEVPVAAFYTVADGLLTAVRIYRDTS